MVYGQTDTNRHIGYLPDVPEFYGFMNPMEYLRVCGEITGLKQPQLDERCRELLELVGLGGEKHRIKGFSRGMKQRLGIAQALLNRPKLLICDEPTGDLDRQSAEEILGLLQELNREYGKTIVMVTHDPKAAEHASHTLHLDKGVLVEQPAHAV